MQMECFFPEMHPQSADMSGMKISLGMALFIFLLIVRQARPPPLLLPGKGKDAWNSESVVFQSPLNEQQLLTERN